MEAIHDLAAKARAQELDSEIRRQLSSLRVEGEDEVTYEEFAQAVESGIDSAIEELTQNGCQALLEAARPIPCLGSGRKLTAQEMVAIGIRLVSYFKEAGQDAFSQAMKQMYVYASCEIDVPPPERCPVSSGTTPL
ncbi:MAG: hypothetical protein NTU41_07405 [Chloroflexi bacterium]|nr:hypothetical protein [Chloroflexota bacterium]